ncbi:hypothetical protein PanWU01x14_096800, partial [Parasponia andersonii]
RSTLVICFFIFFPMKINFEPTFLLDRLFFWTKKKVRTEIISLYKKYPPILVFISLRKSRRLGKWHGIIIGKEKGIVCELLIIQKEEIFMMNKKKNILIIETIYVISE